MVAPIIQVGTDVSIRVISETSFDQGQCNCYYTFAIGHRFVQVDGTSPLSFQDPISIAIERVSDEFLLINCNNNYHYLVDAYTGVRSYSVLAIAGDAEGLCRVAQKVDELRVACFNNGYTSFYHNYSERPEAVVQQSDGTIFHYDGAMLSELQLQQGPYGLIFEHLGMNYQVTDCIWSVNGHEAFSNFVQISS